MKENGLLWIVDIICSIVFGTTSFFSPRNSQRISLPLLTWSRKKIWINLCILFPVWDRVGLTLLLPFFLQRVFCFILVRFKILRYSLKRNIGRIHVLKVDRLHDSDIDFLFCLYFYSRITNDQLVSCDHLFFSSMRLFLFLNSWFSEDK